MLTDWASKLGTQPQPGLVAVAGSLGGFSGAWAGAESTVFAMVLPVEWRPLLGLGHHPPAVGGP